MKRRRTPEFRLDNGTACYQTAKSEKIPQEIWPFKNLAYICTPNANGLTGAAGKVLDLQSLPRGFLLFQKLIFLKKNFWRFASGFATFAPRSKGLKVDL